MGCNLQIVSVYGKCLYWILLLCCAMCSQDEQHEMIFKTPVLPIPVYSWLAQTASFGQIGTDPMFDN